MFLEISRQINKQKVCENN